MTTGREPSVGGDQRIDVSGEEPKLGGQSAILHMVEMLNHTDRFIRYRAALMLAEHNDQRVYEILIEILADRNCSPRLQERAVMALGHLGERAIVMLMLSVGTVPPPLVIKALAQVGGDEAIEAIAEIYYQHLDDRNVFLALEQSLPKIGGPRVVNFLVTTVKNPALSLKLRTRAALVLSKMGNQVVEPLLPLLHHPSTDVRLFALTAIWDIDDDRLVEPLIALLGDEYPVVVEWAIKSLVNLGVQQAAPCLIPLLKHENRLVVISAMQGLGILGNHQAVPQIIDILNQPESYPKDSFILETAVTALGMIGDVQAVKPLVNLLGSSNELLRNCIIYALQEIDHPEAVKALEDAGLDSQRNAAGLVGTQTVIGTDIARQALSTVISLSQGTVLRHTTFRGALRNILAPRMVEPFAIALLRHSDPYVRAETVDMLSSFTNHRIVNLLIEALDDPDDRVRWHAARSLGRCGNGSAVEPLIAALGDRRAAVRGYAAESLAKIGDIRAVEPLIHALHHDPQIKGAAALALGKLGDGRAYEPLMTAITRGNAREAAVIAIGRLGDRRAAATLIDVLNEFGEDSKQAAEALGQLGDEQAIEPLKNTFIRAAREITDAPIRGDDHRLRYYLRPLMSACIDALDLIDTPEALAAIEDLPFRDLGDEA